MNLQYTFYLPGGEKKRKKTKTCSNLLSGKQRSFSFMLQLFFYFRVISYQTLPRNMPSHRAPVMARYPEGYRTLPRNSKTRPESICSVTPSAHDKAAGPGAEEKRRSMRDDTMWQLYEWQQRQFYSRQGTLPRHSTLTSPKTMASISDQTMHSIPTSPSHGSIAAYQGFSPQRTYRSEVSSPIQRGDVTIDRRDVTVDRRDVTIDRRHRAHHPKVRHLLVQGSLLL